MNLIVYRPVYANVGPQKTICHSQLYTGHLSSVIKLISAADDDVDWCVADNVRLFVFHKTVRRVFAGNGKQSCDIWSEFRETAG